jgi:hypothetical protein
VRGNEGAFVNKTRIFYNRKMAAMACMEEALNGYSVVFSGTILAVDADSLRSPGATCVQRDPSDGMNDLEASLKMHKTGWTNYIWVWW